MKMIKPIVFLICTVCAVVNPIAGFTDTITVDPNNVYVASFEGWGTSLAWWANVIGGWSSNRDAIADRIFSPTSGLGLNFVRYNIGASTGSPNCVINQNRFGAQMDCFKSAESAAYDWTRDANQRWMLQAAKDRGATMFEAFANSPPWWMTVTQCPAGNGCADNLKSGYYAAYADFITEVVKHFRDSWGITFQTIEPFNEPALCWAHGTGERQEGCYMARATMNQVIKEVKAKLDSKSMSYVRISATDSSACQSGIDDFNSFDATAKSYVYQMNTHTYDPANMAGFKSLADQLGKRCVHTEVDNGGASGHDHNNVESGIILAERITTDIRGLKPLAWTTWQVVEDETNMVSENSNWGIIHAQFNSANSAYYLTKKYYAFMQFTKYIRPGYKIVDANNGRILAAYNSSYIVITNYNPDAASYNDTYDLSRFGNVGSTATPYRTSSTENCAQLSNISVSNKSFVGTAAAKSVTTWVIPIAGGSLKGDVNSNGTVDIVDALLVAQYYVGLNPSGFNSANADVNCSGSIDIVDALLIAQYYVGLVTSFPC